MSMIKSCKIPKSGQFNLYLPEGAKVIAADGERAWVQQDDSEAYDEEDPIRRFRWYLDREEMEGWPGDHVVTMIDHVAGTRHLYEVAPGLAADP